MKIMVLKQCLIKFILKEKLNELYKSLEILEGGGKKAKIIALNYKQINK